MKRILLPLLILFIVSNITQSQEKTDYDKYMQERGRVVLSDDMMRDGSGIILSEDERTVDDYLSELREDFISNSKRNFPPSYYFYRYRDIIDTSHILGIIRMMPKGSLLHSHSSAIGSPEWLIKKACYMDNLYMYVGETQGDYVFGSLGFYNSGTEPPGYKLIADMRKNNPNFDDELRRLLFLNESDFQNPDIWVRFEEIFTRQDGLLKYYPLFLEYNYVMIDSLIADNVQHLEIRTFLSSVYDLDGTKYDNEAVLNIYRAILDTVQMKHPEFSMKLIRSGYRGWSKETVLANMVQTISLRKKYPDFLMGYDLVGEEDAGHSTLYFIDEFLKRDSLEKAYGIDLPFYFHDGESTLPTNDNMYDAVLLNSRRIGHGFNLFRFPELFGLIKEKDIALEVCPLSSQILGYNENLRMHPASEYIDRGIPITISSDDPMLFDYSGLSYDYWSAYMAWDLGLAQMKQLAMNSINYSTMDDTEKQTAMNHFNAEWDEWIRKVIDISR